MSQTAPQMATSNFNLTKINTTELIKHLDLSINLGSNIMLIGRRGTGKTEISTERVSYNDMEEVYLNLSMLERTDLGGYPNMFAVANEKEKKDIFVKYILPQFYEKLMVGDKKCVLVLDEVDKADHALWAPLLEIVQFHKVNGTLLKNLWCTIMTGNLISEGGQQPTAPLLDRSEKYLVEADLNQWLKWPTTKGKIHPSVTSYLTDNPKDLFGAVDPEGRYADPSPRSWSMASKLVTQGEKLNINNDLLNQKVSGCVGNTVGIKYQVYFNHYVKMVPFINKLFNGDKSAIKDYKDLKNDENGVSLQFIFATIACYKLASILDEANPNNPPEALNIMGQFMENVLPDTRLTSIRSGLGLPRLVKFNLLEHPAWADLLMEVTNQLNV